MGSLHTHAHLKGTGAWFAWVGLWPGLGLGPTTSFYRKLRRVMSFQCYKTIYSRNKVMFFFVHRHNNICKVPLECPQIPKVHWLRVPTFCSAHRSPRFPKNAFVEISDVLFCAQEPQQFGQCIVYISNVFFCTQESQNLCNFNCRDL